MNQYSMGEQLEICMYESCVDPLEWELFSDLMDILDKEERMKKPSAKQTKVRKVMHEYKEGTLHSGKGGPVVRSRDQAIAIALSEAGRRKKK